MFCVLRRRSLAGSSDAREVRNGAGVVVDRGRSQSSINATVVFLDDTESCFELDKKAKGQALLEAVFEHLQLIETDYFGLQFTKNGLAPSPANSDLLKWLNPSKSLRKQMRGGPFYFRVQFYASSLDHLREEYTRHHLYLQLRKDIICERLVVSPSIACLLAGYAVQSELGDYQPEEHKMGYLSGMALIPGQTELLEKRISDFHKSLIGVSPAKVEYSFLDYAVKLDMYGVDLHEAKDSSDNKLDIGVTCNGLVVFQNNIRINMILWIEIVQISFKRKRFSLKLRKEMSENHDTVLSFKMMTYRSSKQLWESCSQHHLFFQLNEPVRTSNNQGFIHAFLNCSRFSYSGRTDIQTMEDSMSQPRTHRTFLRFKSRCNSLQSVNNNSVENNITNCTKSIASKETHDNKVKLFEKEPRPALGPNPSIVSDNEESGFISSVGPSSCRSSSSGIGLPAISRPITNCDGMSRSVYDIPVPSAPSDLIHSIIRLEYGLKSGSLITQFQQLDQCNPDAPMDSAYAEKNAFKNRYRDIYPYDSTRFILKDQKNDYINASYINMEIPGSGIINRYIATQGPLEITIGDFWKMVLESRSCLTVMVTPLIEGNKEKCVEYWPPLYESVTNSNIIIKTVLEKIDSTKIIHRQIELTDLSSNETRVVTQLQFCLWPDRGVPEDPDALLSLVEVIRKKRTGVVDPVIVHCSAGIGRTGVIILLETALCLLEAGQPVYPLRILKQMRDQRAYMIQTMAQFKFVCNCIYYTFTGSLVE